jgi:O-antigen/teichoic acid export membrane protein
LLFTQPVLSIFGSDFITANWTLKILVIGRLVDALCGSVGSLMVMTGHQNKSLPVFGWCALMNIVLNAITIPYLGMVGAAIATSITMITWNIWLSVLVIKYVKVNPSIFSALFKPDSKSVTDT